MRKPSTEPAQPRRGYRSWRKAQDFLISLGWLALAAGAIPIPLAVLAVELGIVESSSFLGTLVFFSGMVGGLIALPIGLFVATWSGVALVGTGVRARLYAASDDILTFRESGAFPLVNGGCLLLAEVLTLVAVVFVGLHG